MSEVSKYLKLARAAREEKNSEDAKKFYDMVRTDEPDNGEAKFFFQYYSLYEGANKEISTRFLKIVNGLEGTVKMIAESSDTAEEKLTVLRAVVEAYAPMTWSLYRYMCNLTVGSGENRQHVFAPSERTMIRLPGIRGAYTLGNAVEKYFSDSPEGMAIAVIAWKEGVSLDQTFPTKDSKAEEYAAKIQKIDSSYVMPKKAGCVSGNKKQV